VSASNGTDPRHAEAKRLRDDGWLLREIAAQFGVSTSTIMRWTNAEYNARHLAQSRANRLRYRGECRDCGTPTIGDAPGNAPERCIPCNGAHVRALTRAWIIDSFREWHALFGAPPTATDWNPAKARSRGRGDLAERYASTGRPWPGTSVVMNHFGSWNAGMLAAGFEPIAAGQRRDPRAWRANLVAAQREHHRPYRERVARLWREGRTTADVAEALGTTPGAASNLIARMRRDGWDLPRRTGGRKAAA
jgi:transposase